MLSTVRCWLSPPIFEGDADKTRRAALVNAVLLAAAALALLLIAGNWLGGSHIPPPVLAIDGGVATLCLVLRAWMRRGGVQPASAGLVALSFGGLTAGVALLGSVRAPAAAAYLLVVILAGLLLDQGGLLAAGALSSLAVGGLILAENAGWLPRLDYAVGVTQWVTYTALFGIASSLSLYALHATRQALSRADAELAERKQVEEALRLSEARLKSLFELSQQEYATEKELVDHALEEAVRLTGSQIGYFHFVEADEVNLELFTWSRRVQETCTAATDRHYPLEAAGVWADCVRLKRPVVHNDYQNLPERKGYPAGHSPITRHLSVPILDGDRVVAIAGVGNKEAPYDDTDARQLQLFTGEVWRMITHKRAEAERERLIDELQAAFDNIKTLHGLIPICANCKKIRDDQGYWQDVAVYVRDHSEADFTHGICPDCAEKLYPEFCANTDRATSRQETNRR